MLLDVPEHTLQATLQRLEQFIFSEDVRVESLAASVAPVWVHGPQAEGVLGRVLPAAQGLGEWPEYHHAQLTLGGLPVSVARISQLGVPGFCVFVERARASECVAAIAAEGAVVVSPEALAAARIEAGYPVFGVDMTDDTIPLEAGIEQRAISFTKGCYVGQEVVIRILHRGHGRVVRKLAPLRIEGAPPAHGAKIHAGDREIGFITSAAASPRSGTIALGYVHRDFLAPGTSVEVEAGAARAHAVVTDQAGLMAV
jgi:folate-binding protein YgfZ